MVILKSETVGLANSADIVWARQRARQWAMDMGFRLVDQTKIVTATSELARNTLDYGGGGEMVVESVQSGPRTGLRLTFRDQGPGIADIELALTDGYTSGSGMGLGLSGSRRLMDEMNIESAPGKGTTVTITRWK